MNKEEKCIPFEEALEELEEIIKKLEYGDLSLDDSLSEFQRGVELYKHCNKTLNNVEGKIKLILENEYGEIEEIDFEESE